MSVIECVNYIAYTFKLYENIGSAHQLFLTLVIVSEPYILEYESWL